MCGIGGIINVDKRASFDYQTFTTLGIANDTRGGDSCGIFIDGEVEYGVNEKKLFQDFFADSKLLAKTTKAQIALVHCRKASIGKVTLENAQPVVITGKGGSKEVKFVMIHNGTIHNYEDLAKKYIPEIDIKGLTDSQVLARIFYYKGYDCLSEYIGGAAFVVVDYRQPSPLVLLWRGVSKKTENSNTEDEERPLWLVSDKNRIIFSSIPKWLQTTARKTKLLVPRENTLVKFDIDKGELEIFKEYPRKNSFQTKSWGREYVGYYGGFYGAGYQGGYQNNQAQFQPQKKKEEALPSFLKEDFGTNTYSFRGTKGDSVHGMYKISKFGRIYEKDEKTDFKTFPIAFYNGVPLRAYRYYRFLEYLQIKCKMKAAEFFEKYENVVRFFSVDQLFKKNNTWFKATYIDSYEVYTGTYQQLGSMWVSNIERGNITKQLNTEGDYATPFEVFDKPDGVVLSKINEECKLLMN